MNSQDHITNLIRDFSSLLSSELSLEEIFSSGDQKIKRLRVLYQQDKFSDETVEIIKDFQSIIEKINVALDAKKNLHLIRSQEEIEDYILDIDFLSSNNVLSDLNIKRLGTIKRILLEKYQKVPSERLIHAEKELVRSFGTAPNCPKCTKKMVLRGDENYFWGCRDFPQCWGTVHAKNKTKDEDKSHKYDQNFDQELFDKLKELRKTLSVKENVPAYCIAWDQTLIDCATIKPINHSDLIDIVRIGKAFIKKYGDRFITVIKNHINQNK